ncbi:MAG: hypothetical protein WCW13_02220 [archaeon]|jgi:predicted transcriptional regulator
MFLRNEFQKGRLINYGELYVTMVNATTIQVSAELKNTLEKRKMVAAESYEEVIWDLLEDTMELSEETKRDIAKAEEDYKAGRYITMEDLKKKLGFK